MEPIQSTQNINGAPLNGSAQQQTQSSNKGVSISGQTCYIDFGAADMPQPPSQAYIAQLVTDLQNAGVTTVNLSFDQVNGGIDPKYQTAYESLISQAKSEKMSVVMSFGGEMATQDNWTPNSGSLAAVEDLVTKYNLDGLDFDVETYTLPAGLTDFLTSLHTFCHDGRNVNMTLTVMGYPGNSVGTYVPPWNEGTGPLAPLFFNGQMDDPTTMKVTFPNMFDGLNLMMYGSSQDIISGGKPTSDLQQWVNIINYLNIPSKSVHIGFMDGISYGTQTPNTYEAGVEAANAYIEALAGLTTADGKQPAPMTPSDFGTPFWWPQEGSYADRYEDGKNSGVNDPVDFDNQMMQGFSKTLTTPK